MSRPIIGIDPVTLVIPYAWQSHNTYNQWHWSRRHKDTKLAEGMIVDALIQARIQRPPMACNKPMALHLIRYCRQACTDDANLRGGGKSLVDAIKRVGLIKDDSDEWATITYEQIAPLSKCPHRLGRKVKNGAVHYCAVPCVEIRIEPLNKEA